MDRHGAEDAARTDYQRALGTVIEVTWVYGYTNDDSVEIQCDPPAKVRVLETPDEDLRHWVDEWLDPFWNIELSEPHPAIGANVRGLWTFGHTSYAVPRMHGHEHQHG